MTENDTPTSWLSKAVLIGAIIALLLLPLGALGSRLGLWQFTMGFLMLGGGAILSIVAVVGGLVGLILASRAGRSADRRGLYTGMVLSVAILGFLLMQFNTATSVPPIHNISTDVTDPPGFEEIVALREGSNPLAYDATALVTFQDQEATYAEIQQVAYPGVRTREVPLSPEQSVDVAVRVLESMGMEIVSTNPAEGLVEATDTTFWFGFKDDVVVRIRESGEGSVVDVRSVSRVGQSDLGKNAARIVEILDRLDGD